MKKIVIGVSSENENDLVRKIAVIQRQTDNLGNLVASGYTNQYGGLIIEVPDGEYLVIKEANSNVENSQVYDYVTPVEYQELSFKVVNYDSQWIYLKPQTIAMSYSNTVSIKSFLGEFRINGGAWTTATFIKDGDTLEMRLPTPIGGVYSEAANYRIKVGPYTYQYKSFDDSAGLTIPAHQTSFYKIQNIKPSIFSFENRVSFYKIQNIKPSVFSFENQVSFYRIQNIKASVYSFENRVSFYKVQNIVPSIFSFENRVSFFKIQVIRTI